LDHFKKKINDLYNDYEYKKLYNSNKMFLEKWNDSTLNQINDIINQVTNVLSGFSKETFLLIDLLSDEEAENLLNWLFDHNDTNEFNQLILGKY
jgi:uncharacterized membrane protein YdbT with pleckstrin-like domain